jgi:hypothetical protein
VFTDWSMCPWLVLFGFVLTITLVCDVLAIWIAFTDPGVIKTPKDIRQEQDNNFGSRNFNNEDYRDLGDEEKPPHQQQQRFRSSDVVNNHYDNNGSSSSSFDFDELGDGLKGIVPDQKHDWCTDLVPTDMSYCSNSFAICKFPSVKRAFVVICNMNRPRRAKRKDTIPHEF